MKLKEFLKKYLPLPLKYFLFRFVLKRLSRARRESNRWLKERAAAVSGRTLSIGSGADEDGEGGKYRDYFKNCSSYTTSEVAAKFNCDMVLDVRNMRQIPDDSFDCVFCSGVLEHVDDYQSGLGEMTRILKRGGILFLGLPFRQAIHGAPNDYWRFTEHGIKFLLSKDYEIVEIKPVDCSVKKFPAGYWIKAKKL